MSKYLAKWRETNRKEKESLSKTKSCLGRDGKHGLYHPNSSYPIIGVRITPEGAAFLNGADNGGPAEATT